MEVLPPLPESLAYTFHSPLFIVNYAIADHRTCLRPSCSERRNLRLVFEVAFTGRTCGGDIDITHAVDRAVRAENACTKKETLS